MGCVFGLGCGLGVFGCSWGCRQVFQHSGWLFEEFDMLDSCGRIILLGDAGHPLALAKPSNMTLKQLFA